MDEQFAIARIYTGSGAEAAGADAAGAEAAGADSTRAGAVCGAGFLVGPRRVLTCAHVVSLALGLPGGAVVPEASPMPEGTLTLDFPLAGGAERHAAIRARVVFWDARGDVAGLELLDDAPPGLRPLLFETETRAAGRAFRAFGFPRGYNDGKWTHGVVLDRQGRGWQQLEADKGFGDFVQQGFSGAPVLAGAASAGGKPSAEGGRVLGMVAGVDGEHETRTGYMIPTAALLAAWPDLRRLCLAEQARRLLEGPASGAGAAARVDAAAALLARARREFPDDAELARLERQTLLRRWRRWLIGGAVGLACLAGLAAGFFFFISPSQAGHATSTPTIPAPSQTPSPTGTATPTDEPTPTPTNIPPTATLTPTATPAATRTPTPRLAWVREPVELFEAAEGEARTGLVVARGSVWHVCDVNEDQTRYQIARSHCHLTAPAGWIAVEAIGFGPTPTPPPTATATPPPTATPTATPTPPIATDGKGHELLRIPAGPFNMGSLDGQADERPVHEVVLGSYFIDRFEVTAAQYARCAAEGFPGCALPGPQLAGSRYTDPAYADHPATWVTWGQAQAYCQWRGGRLPSEAEWERAAGGGAVQPYAWGSQPPNCELALYGGCYRTPDGRYDTRAVGTYPLDLSPLGVRDMAGGVIEWVYDWYAENAYELSLLDPRPLGPSDGERRSARGYGFNPLGITEPDRLRLTDRSALEPGGTYANVGFRCVIEANAPNLVEPAE